jgi:hypothetical protein
MRHKHSGGALVLAIMALLATGAQQPGKIARIGVLRSGSPPGPFVKAFRQGLQEPGYAAGRNITTEYR